MDKLEKFKQILSVLKEDTVSYKQFADSLKVLVDVIKNAVDETRTLTGKSLEENQVAIYAAINQLEEGYIKVKNDLETSTNSKIDKLSKDTEKTLKQALKALEVVSSIKVRDGIDGVDGIDGKDGKDGSPDTSDQIIDKINDSEKIIKAERVEGISKLASQENLDRAISILDQRTQFLINKRTSSGGVQSVVAGTNITVDNTDPSNPVISSTSGGVGGSGTLNYIPKWTPSGSTLGNSSMYEDTNTVITSKDLRVDGGTIQIGSTGVQLQNSSGNLSLNGGYLLATSGGTGQTGYTVGDILYADTTTTLAKLNQGANGTFLGVSGGVLGYYTPAGSGTVTSVSVVSANGFAGTVATATSTPAITLTTTITGVLKGNGTAISAATDGTDYLSSTTGLKLDQTSAQTITNDSPIFNTLTASKVVFTTAGKKLTSTGIGTSAQFIKGDGSLDSTTYQPSGTYVTSVGATSPITSSGGTTPTISTSMATNKLIGRGTAGTGVMEEITLGTNLSLSGTTLNAASPSGAALTKTDDTNVTLTLGGSPTTALLAATSLTLGWTGTLADGRIASASTWNAKVGTVASADGSVTVTGTTAIDLAVVKAPKWTTARLLAGNSVDGSANVAFANKFIVQGTTDTGLSGAQFLGALSTGIVKNTTTTGVLSIATAGTDYADNAFKTISVAGQSDVVADSASDTLTLVAGSNVTITTNASTDTITIAATGSGGTTSQYIDQTPDNGTYGLLSGTVNGSNTTFTVSQGSYGTGTLQVYKNGVLQLQGASDDWQETTPASGTFDFITAPATNDIITAVYQNVAGTTIGITAKDEGSTLTTALSSLDFVGAGVVATNSGGAVTVTIAGGSGGYTVNTVTAATVNASATSGEVVYLADTTSNSITLNLPTAVGNTAKFHIKKINSANTLTIDGATTETIDGSTTVAITVVNESITIISDNANWQVI